MSDGALMDLVGLIGALNAGLQAGLLAFQWLIHQRLARLEADILALNDRERRLAEGVATIKGQLQKERVKP